MSPVARRRRIIELLRERPIASQEEIVTALSSTGEAVTQATVSRDLRALGVVKGPSGYLPPESNGMAPATEHDPTVAQSVLAVRPAASLVVVSTLIGYANAVGALLDRLRPEEMVGCVAGDDTALIATRSEQDADHLARRLNDIFEIE